MGLTGVTSLRIFMRESIDVKIDGVSVTATPSLDDLVDGNGKPLTHLQVQST